MKTTLIGLGIILALCLALYALNLRNNNLELQRNNALADKAALQSQIHEAEERAKLDAKIRSDYLNRLHDNQISIDNLASDLAAKPERVYIRATCPAVPKADDTGRAETQAVELDAATRKRVQQLERDILILRRDAGIAEAWIDSCQKTVFSWGK